MPIQGDQMFEHAIDAVKGWFHGAALDKSAKLAAAVLGVTTVPAGRVAIIDDNGEFVINRGAATVSNAATAMPIFLWNGSNHTDVYNNGVSSGTSLAHWYGISSTGTMSGLVATGGYELQTTEYDTTQTYLPNQLLTANATTGVMTNQGAVQYVNWICGIASWHVQSDAKSAAATGPEGTNAHGVSTLTFWTYFLPAEVAQ